MADQALTAYIRAAAPAGLSQDGDEFFVVRNVSGTDVILRAGPMKRGFAPSKDLVTTLVSGQNIRVYDPVNDRGYILRSLGPDINIVQIPNYAFTQITLDSTYGEPLFYLARRSIGMCFVNPQPGINLRPGPVTIFQTETPNPLANQTAMTNLLGVLLGDCIYRSDTSTYWVRTTGSLTVPSASTSVLGDWTQMPAGAPGLMTIYNDEGLELQEMGPERRYTFVGPNQVIAS